MPANFALPLTGVAVLHTTKPGCAYAELHSDVPHQFGALDKQVATALREREVATMEKPDIHQGDLALAEISLIEAPDATTVSIADKPSPVTAKTSCSSTICALASAATKIPWIVPFGIGSPTRMLRPRNSAAPFRAEDALATHCHSRASCQSVGAL